MTKKNDNQVGNKAKILKGITEYLQVRLGVFHLDFQEDPDSANVWRFSTREEDCGSFPPIGAFKHIIQSYSVRLSIWADGTKGTFVARPGLRYTHHGGGSNGHDMNFQIVGNLNGLFLREE